MDGRPSKRTVFPGGQASAADVAAIEAEINADIAAGRHLGVSAFNNGLKAIARPVAGGRGRGHRNIDSADNTIPDLPREPAAPQLWSADLDWTESTIPQRDWIAPGYLIRGSVSVFVGAGSTGKSTLMVAYAVALALGRPCNRMRPVAPCRVMTYNVEDDANEQRRRLSAALRPLGGKPADLLGKVVIVGPTAVGTLLRRDANSCRVHFEPAMLELEKRIEAFRPDVLMLDPLAELHGCDENDNTALRSIMAAFRALAVKYRMSVVLLHHTRKGSAGAAGDPDSGRGASAINSAARSVFTVASMTEDEGKTLGLAPGHHKSLFRLDGAKSNYAPTEAAEWFERQALGLDNGDQVVAAVPWAPPVDVVSAEIRSAIEARVALGTSAGPYSPKLSLDARSIKHVFLEHGITTAAGQSAALKELTRADFQTVSFKNRVNRRAASGLRSPDGAPRDVEWVETDQSGLTAKRCRSGAKPVRTAPVPVL